MREKGEAYRECISVILVTYKSLVSEVKTPYYFEFISNDTNIPF